MDIRQSTMYGAQHGQFQPDAACHLLNWAAENTPPNRKEGVLPTPKVERQVLCEITGTLGQIDTLRILDLLPSASLAHCTPSTHHEEDWRLTTRHEWLKPPMLVHPHPCVALASITRRTTLCGCPRPHPSCSSSEVQQDGAWHECRSLGIQFIVSEVSGRASCLSCPHVNPPSDDSNDATDNPLIYLLSRYRPMPLDSCYFGHVTLGPDLLSSSMSSFSSVIPCRTAVSRLALYMLS